MNFHVQTYTGTEVARCLPSPFRPRGVIIWRNDGAWNPAYRLAVMPDGKSSGWDGAADDTVTNQITGFEDWGFTLGTSKTVNEIGGNYLAFAWSEDSSVEAQGTYVGEDNSIDVDITTGFQANFIRLHKASADLNPCSNIKHPADNTGFVGDTGVAGADITVNSTGFTVEGGGQGNDAGETYYWFAWKLAAGTFDSFTGNGSPRTYDIGTAKLAAYLRFGTHFAGWKSAVSPDFSKWEYTSNNPSGQAISISGTTLTVPTFSGFGQFVFWFPQEPLGPGQTDCSGPRRGRAYVQVIG